MSIEAAAQDTLRSICGTGFRGIGIVLSDTPLSKLIPRRRATTFMKEQRRLRSVWNTIHQHLVQGGSIKSAREIIRSEGFANCISIAESYPDLLDAVITRFRSGDNACDAGLDDGIAYILLWHATDHPRVH